MSRYPFKEREPVEPLFYTINDLIQLLGVSRTLINSQIKQGRIKSVKIGSCVRIPAQQVKELVAGQTFTDTPWAPTSDKPALAGAKRENLTSESLQDLRQQLGSTPGAIIEPTHLVQDANYWRQRALIAEGKLEDIRAKTRKRTQKAREK